MSGDQHGEDAVAAAAPPATGLSPRLGRSARRAAARFQGSSGREALTGYLFVLPALLFYVVFLAAPTLATVLLSFFDWAGDSFATLEWTGVSNYTELFGDDVFKEAFLNNIIFLVVGTGATVAVALILAALLEQNLPGTALFRGAFFMPTVISFIVVGIVFILMASPELGLINPMLDAVGLGGLQRAWLGDPQTALPSVIVATVWRDFGFAMLIFIAGLKGLDRQVFEAARLDGANAFQIFWRVTLPLLRPVTVTVVVLVTIGMLKVFDSVFVMTKGGPNHSSEVLSTFMYNQAFSFERFGYGAAIAVFILVITLIVAIVQFRVGRDRT